MPDRASSYSEDAVIKSPADGREYCPLTLDNGLQVLLIRQPDETKAAAALAVNAGHFDDPEDRQGLAHFLEHLLFLGTEAFPEVNAYSDFLATHGGHHNAWTGTEHSNFFFDVSAEQFSPALARFASQFIAPLFSQQWIERERQSIESEFRLKEKDELRRLYQVHKETSNPNHPFHKFSVGNLLTLRDLPGVSIRQQLLDFFKQHYHAGNMRLVLAGPQPLAELAALAHQHFAQVQPNKGRKEKISAPLYRADQLGVQLHLRPLKRARRLILTFALPAIDDDYRRKTTSFIAHILGYEGPDSLCSWLKAQGWINTLSAGGGISGSNFKDFNINIQLTADGLSHTDDICAAVFAYIRELAAHGIEDWRYREKQQLSTLSFRYQEPVKLVDWAAQLAVNMHHYDVADSIFGDYRMDGLDAAKAQQWLALMTPANARITLVSQQLPTSRCTTLYQAEYHIQPLSNAQLARYQQPPAAFSAKLPKTNPYIDADVSVFEVATEQSLPRLHHQQQELTVWYLQENQFRSPKGHLYVDFKLPSMATDQRLFATARLWCELVMDSLAETCYDAEIAGLHSNIYPHPSGICWHITGLSRRQLALLDQLLAVRNEHLAAPSRWEDLRQTLINNWTTAYKNQPINLLFSELNQQIQPGCFRLSDLAEELQTLSFDEYQQCLTQLWSPLEISAFMHGNWLPEHADQLVQRLQQELPARQADAEQPLMVKQLQRPSQQKQTVRSQHKDAAVILYNQGADSSHQEQAHYLIAQHLLAPQIFQQLRTEQQLGYVVGSHYLSMQRLPGSLMFVQSHDAPIEQVQAAIEQFIQNFGQSLNQLTDIRWKEIQQTLGRQLSVKDANLRSKSQRFWGQISLGEPQFEQQQQLQRIVNQCSRTKWIRWFSERFLQKPAALWLNSYAQL
ncbi:peptidase M16 [Idiomarina tyrosinivorans]|uniref:Protease 3 n=1 Tax=Idiomarina tyrosinivorans TaxID=1445662 RepID=A0A432ZR61_9GAMM|nr:insulinase family protein [Idiomarina tyrosinivorans]RUO80415.1 peptidase M16 [Idiomarina tyrosinivorans]